MKHFKTFADIGSVLVGNEDWTFAVPNKGGDGETDVFISDKGDIKREIQSDYHSINYIFDQKGKRHDLNFISSVQGKFGIYENDTDYSDKAALKKPLIILEGRYGVYNGEWCVVFEKWE
jgi:hypothetical protein